MLAGVLIGVLLTSAVFAFYLAMNRGRVGGGQQVLRMAHALDASHPVHFAMVRFAEIVAERTNGELDVRIYPGGQLGGESQYIEQLQAGTLDMAKTSAGPIESFVPTFSVFSLPYVFRDADHYWQVLESDVGDDLLLAGVDRGLRGLCYYDAGARSFYTTQRPIEQPSDLRGLKIRVQQSRTAMDMILAMGGSPTPVPWGELYTALQQGMVDGAENNLISYLGVRHFEVSKHFSLNEHTRVPDLVLISETAWQTLSPTHQRVLLDAAAESSRYQRELWATETAEAIELLREQGVSFTYPDQEPFVATVQPLLDSYRGTEVGELIDRIRAVTAAPADASPSEEGVP